MKTKLLLTAPIIILFLFIASCSKRKPGFTANKTEAFVGEPIVFTDNENSRRNCTFTYDFGDGSNSSNPNSNLYSGNYGNSSNGNAIYSDRNPSHAYWNPGTYTVTQTISRAGNQEKGRNKQRSVSMEITIKPIVPDFSPSAIVSNTGQTLTLTNLTTIPQMSTGYGAGTGWVYTAINSTDPSSSTQGVNYTIAVDGNSSGYTGSLPNAYIKFLTPGVWRVSLTYGIGYYVNTTTKQITIN